MILEDFEYDTLACFFVFSFILELYSPSKGKVLVHVHVHIWNRAFLGELPLE